MARVKPKATLSIEENLRAVINAIPARVWSISPDGEVDFSNQRVFITSDFVLRMCWDGIGNAAAAFTLTIWHSTSRIGAQPLHLGKRWKA